MNILRVALSGDLCLSTKLEIIRLKTMTLIGKFSNSPKSRPDDISGRSTMDVGIFKYKGFTFYYHNEGVRADLLKSGNWSYDEDISRVISKELAKEISPVFLDIGAHAGFMTLNVLEKIPSARVFAFEPGTLQGSLFEKTIKANKLDERVTLYKEALGRETGTTSFICQEWPDADWSMNNGILDTGRGKGKQKLVTVPVRTLDNWWKSAGKPKINVMKMDTEGAELWILQGATEFLSICRPTILLEINPLNLHVYPYGAKDILLWFNKHNYNLETTNGDMITPKNLKQFLKSNESFVARPRTSD